MLFFFFFSIDVAVIKGRRKGVNPDSMEGQER